MNFTKYENYKDSGLKWLGEIPEDWKIERNKEIFFEASQKSETGEETLLTVSHITGVTPRSEKNVNMFFAETMEGYKVCKVGDLLINTMWAWMGALGTSNYDGICSPAYGVYRQRKWMPYNHHYFDYLFRVPNFVIEMTRFSKGIVSSRLRLYPSEFFQIKTPLPSYEIQTAIAEYLNEKTLQINKRIGLLKAKREKYQELRKTIVNEVVTKGLNKNIELEDSGISWIGKIPKHWNFERFGDKFKQNKRKNTNLENDNLLSLSYGKIKRKDINSSLGLLPESFDTYQIVEKGDIILRLTDLQNDWNSLRVGLVKENGIITSAYVGLKLSKLLFPAYIYYLLHNYDIKKVFYSQGGSIRQSMKFTDIKSLPLLYPDFDSQVEIANYLDEKTGKIDQIILTIDKNIEALNEFRKTLINDAVTGKIKIVPAEKHAV